MNLKIHLHICFLGETSAAQAVHMRKKESIIYNGIGIWMRFVTFLTPAEKAFILQIIFLKKLQLVHAINWPIQQLFVQIVMSTSQGNDCTFNCFLAFKMVTRVQIIYRASKCQEIYMFMFVMLFSSIGETYKSYYHIVHRPTSAMFSFLDRPTQLSSHISSLLIKQQ